MTTTSNDLLDLVQAALIDATDADDRVYRPGDWPLWDGQFPALKLRVAREDKQSLGRAGVQFNVVTTVRIIGQVSAPADVDDAGAAAVEAALWALHRQVEVAVINSQPLTARLQQFPFVRATLSYTAEGEKHLAGINIDLGLEFYQDEDDFAPLVADPLETVVVTVPDPAAGVTIAVPQI